MKFKEKDPIVSVEQWLPEAEENGGGVGEENDLDYVKEVNANKTTIVQYRVLQNNNRDHAEKLYSSIDESPFDYVSEQVKVYLVEETVNGRTDFVTKMGYRHVGYSGQDLSLALINPSDWVLTYKSGRREVLTDKEKQERFE
jgi:hypothetical protein